VRRVVALCVFTVAAALVGARPAAAQGEPLRFTLKTIDNDAGVRAILEFSRKPVYEVRNDGRRVLVTLREEAVEPPFKKKDLGGAVVDKIKFIEGFRTSEMVFYTGDEFAIFSTFEMGEPFRLVIDFRRKSAPAVAIGIPSAAGRTAAPGGAAPGGATSTTPGGPGPGAPPVQQGGGGRAAAPPAAPAAPSAPPRAAFVVVIDPGHGGDDTGALGPSGLAEKDVTLDLARRLKQRLLAGMDVEVLLTREADKTMALDDRTAIANHARADLFVSIHANSSRRANARGAETYFLSYQATDDESRAVAAIENNTLGLDAGVQGNSNLEMLLWDLAQTAFLKESSALAEIIQDKLNAALDIDNRGIKQAPFRVLMGATMPAVLVEIAFISNSEEERRLRDGAFKDRLAATIEDSIERFHDKFVRNQAPR
jgi:N-acetylmuramoyl-L-alanine amidase